MASDTRLFIAYCWLIFWVFWLVASFSAKKTAKVQSKNWSLRFAVLSLGLYFIMKEAPLLSAYADVRLWPSGRQVDLLADALALSGLVVMVWARLTIGRNWSAEVVLKEDHQLAMTGPYAYVRHPIYTGLLMLMLATAIDYGAVSGFVIFAAFAAVFIYKSRIEERFMAEHFPDAYPAYMKKVKALIPFIF